jgi:hypothetical protein
MDMYEVTRYEIHKSIMSVEAENEIEALQKVNDGDGGEVSFTYIRTCEDMGTEVKKCNRSD